MYLVGKFVKVLMQLPVIMQNFQEGKKDGKELQAGPLNTEIFSLMH